MKEFITRKIDYLTVCYMNYELIKLQIETFNKLFDKNYFRLIIVDNTPNNLKNHKFNDELREMGAQVIEVHSVPGIFDGVSHGSAIDHGLDYTESDIVCVFDSDFFFKRDVTEYIMDKFYDHYDAVGCDFRTGNEYEKFADRNPIQFENRPVVTAGFYRRELAISDTWVVTKEEVDKCWKNPNCTYLTTGWRIRKKMNDENLKTLSWRGTPRGPSYHYDENNELVGFHIWEGSKKSEIITKEIINKL